MNRGLMFAIVALTSIGFGLCGRAIAQATTDPVKADLDAAKAAHTQAVGKASDELLAAIDGQVKTLTTAGNADAAKALANEKTAFIAAGTLPQAPLLKDAVAQYRQATTAADSDLANAYGTAIVGFDKESQIDQAAQARRDRATLLGPNAGDISGGGPSGAVMAPEEIAHALDAAKTEHRRPQTLDGCRHNVSFVVDRNHKVEFGRGVHGRDRLKTYPTAGGLTDGAGQGG